MKNPNSLNPTKQLRIVDLSETDTPALVPSPLPTSASAAECVDCRKSKRTQRAAETTITDLHTQIAELNDQVAKLTRAIQRESHHIDRRTI